MYQWRLWSAYSLRSISSADEAVSQKRMLPAPGEFPRRQGPASLDAANHMSLTRLHANVSLPLPDAATCAQMLTAVLKHALFVQQQIPCPFDELMREVDLDSDGGRHLRGWRRKAAQPGSPTSQYPAKLAC